MLVNYSKRIAFSTLIFFSFFSIAQELKCAVTIDAQQVQTQEKQIFEEMQSAFEDFVNNQTWTEDSYSDIEKINCTIAIQLSQESNVQAGQYIGTAQIQSSRPVFNSDYETTTFYFFDKFVSFTYRPGQNIAFNENSFTNNLTALFSFYAYMILGSDYDSFSELGGSQYYQQAQLILNTVPEGLSDGWDSQKGPNNRWGLVDQANSPQIESLRKELYSYHRVALDNLALKTKESQQTAKELVFNLQKTREIIPTSIFMEGIFMAKENEFVSIFSELPTKEEKEAIYQSLRISNPTNSEKYSNIVKRK